MRAGLCKLCGSRQGERRCPALSAFICSACCGTHRRKVVHCPSNCPHLVAAERRLRARRAAELARSWESWTAAVAGGELADCLPYMELLRRLLAQLLHESGGEDADVRAALQHLNRRLSPIEAATLFTPPLARRVEETLMPLVEQGRLDALRLRGAAEAVDRFVEEFGRDEEPDRFVAGLLGTYPPQEGQPGQGLILRP
ncbi:MAG: hypothetical protein ACP5G2_05470 [Candidatus Bipolaricaulaceae bacterium]